MKLIYLAQPYSHPDAITREQRFHLACQKTVELMEKYFVFSPIINGHPLVAGWGIQYVYTAWRDFNARMIERCDEFHVFCLPGWRESFGLTDEIALATRLEKPIVYHNP